MSQLSDPTRTEIRLGDWIRRTESHKDLEGVYLGVDWDEDVQLIADHTEFMATDTHSKLCDFERAPIPKDLSPEMRAFVERFIDKPRVRNGYWALDNNGSFIGPLWVSTRLAGGKVLAWFPCYDFNEEFRGEIGTTVMLERRLTRQDGPPPDWAPELHQLLTGRNTQ